MFKTEFGLKNDECYIVIIFTEIPNVKDANKNHSKQPKTIKKFLLRPIQS